MSNQWVPGPGGPAQWSRPQPPQVNQQGQQWVHGGGGQWQSMQQASATHQQLHQQFPRQPGYHGYPPQAAPQYPPQQPQPMNQGVHIQEQLARAREEQRVREVELQKRRMMAMNVAEAKPPSSIDTLIGLGNISPAPKKKSPPQKQKLPPAATVTQPASKPRSWTMDTSGLQGVFSQHHTEDDSFGDFQAPPPLQPSGVGVVPTSSYTRPIPSISTGSPLVGQRTRAVSSPHMPRSSGGGLSASAFPPLYMEVYNRCHRDGALSTELLFPVLMSSKLPRAKLGELWQLANRGTPGKLNQTELFVLLGLIGLVQTGHPYPKFEDLQNAPSPPIPVLEDIKGKDPPPASVADDFGSFQQGPSTLIKPAASVSSFGASNSSTVSSFSASTQPTVSSFGASIPSTVSSFGASNPSTVSSFGASTQPTVSSFVASTQPTVSSFGASNQPTQDDKYGVFSELRTLNVETPSMDAFGEFKSATDQPPSTSVQPIVTGAAFATGSVLQPSMQPPPSIVSSSVGDKQVNTRDKFGEFKAVTAKPPEFTAKPSASADFGSFISTQTSTADVSTSSGGWADFAHATPPSVTTPITTAGIGLTPSISQATSTSHLSSKPVSLDVFEPRLEKKALTALDILDEEMSSRLLLKEDSSHAPAPPLVPESLDDFGEFEAFGGGQVNSVPSQQSEPKKPTTDPCEVWRVCLVKSGEVLERCVSVFGGVEEASVLTEIAESEEARNKLRGVVEVYRVAKRVYSALRERESGMNSTDCGRTVQNHWTTLQTQLPNDVMTRLYSDSQPSDKGESLVNDVLSDTISKCCVCLTGKSVDILPGNSLDGQREEYPLTLMFHNGHCYHSSCANFWINIVQEQLPVLA